MKLIREGKVFDVDLVDDGTMDTVIRVNGREERFDVGVVEREEDGTPSESELIRLADDIIEGMSAEEFDSAEIATPDDLVSVAREDTKAEVKLHILDGLQSLHTPSLDFRPDIAQAEHNFLEIADHLDIEITNKPKEKVYETVYHGKSLAAKRAERDARAEREIKTMRSFDVEFSYTITVDARTMKIADRRARYLWDEAPPKSIDMDVEVSNHQEEAYEKAAQADSYDGLGELEAATNVLQQVEDDAKVEELLSTEKRREHDEAAISDVLDRQSVDGIISILADIHNGKSNTARIADKDPHTAAELRRVAVKLEEFTDWYWST